MSGGRIVLLVVGVVLAFFGLGIAVGGGGVLWAHNQRDDQGYLRSPTYELSTDGYALAGQRIDLRAGQPGDWVPWLDAVDVRIDVTPVEADQEVFVGIGPAGDVAAYLDGVAHAEIVRLGNRATDVTYRESAGGPPEAPGDQDFWAASTQGTGTQDLRWTPESGSWAIVVANTDASPGVAVGADAGARLGFLLPLGLAMLTGGLLLLAAATAMVVAATAGGPQDRRGRPLEGPPTGAGAHPAAPAASGGLSPGSTGTAGTGTGGTGGGGRAYPAVLAGRLDDGLSRWLWLVKWLLVIPHVVVLAFLWVAFIVLTIVAGFAILFTGRYPRGIFDFNVGVIRWTWRVAYYSYSALGTDRYPPFSLAATDYPATFEIAYPQRLSRGLVLVKWWLLAIPHYIVVAVFAGSALSWTFDTTADGSWQVPLSGGLIGLLVLVAGLALLFTGRYPHGLFDFVMGLNRWVYRVLAYVTLMTDEYPPFRIDPGGSEPDVPQPPGGTSPAGARSGTQVSGG